LTILANRNTLEPELADTMTLNINLTPQLEKLVRQKVESGRYNSASEVVREALRLMETQNELHALQLERLQRDIRQGLESGPARPWSVAEVKRQGRKLAASRRAGSQ
jgi:antitoxin ParD1/3/4